MNIQTILQALLDYNEHKDNTRLVKRYGLTDYELDLIHQVYNELAVEIRG